MTLYATNFASNSLSGTVVVTGGKANVGLVAVPYYLEGNKTFYVKLRKNSVDGPVIGVTTGTLIPDRSRIVSVTANINQVAEGNLVTYTVVTANVNTPTTLYYDVYGATGNVDVSDFLGGNTGAVNIVGNVGTITLSINPDLSPLTEEGEKFGLNIHSRTQTGNLIYQTNASMANGLVEILDVSKTFTVNQVIANTTILQDNGIVQWAVSTLNANNIPVYYSTIGNLLNSEMTSANTGSFTPVGNSNVYTLTFRVGSVTAEPRNFKLQLRENSVTGNIKFVTPNVMVVAAPIVASGGTLLTSATFNTHAFPGPGTLTITSASPGGKTLDYFVVGGGAGGGYINAGYFGIGGAGGGGFMSGNAKVYTGNTFSATIGGGGSGAIESGNYAGTGATPGNPSYITSTALPYQITAHGSQWAGTNGSTGSGYAGYGANGSPGIGIAGFNGWPGSSDPGGGGGGAGGSGVTTPNPSHPGVYLGAGGIGAGIAVHPSLGTPGPDPTLRYFAGGGGGYNSKPYPGPQTRDSEGGAGGGGASMPYYAVTGSPGSQSSWYGSVVNGKGGYNGFAGNVNTGGGGGSGGSPGGVAQGGDGGAGGSGIVMFRYPTVAGGFTYYP
jgi:hypothetical protein